MKASEFIAEAQQKKVPQKPRQGPLRPQTGGGPHRDRKQERNKGYEKHRGKLDEQSDTPEEEMDRTVSDLHKDVYGVRPDREWGREWMAMSYDEKLKLYHSMIDQLDKQDVSEGYGDKRFEVDGYTYLTYLDIEDDNRKIWHMIKTPDGKTVDVDFTPYEYMTKDDVGLYIKLGMPERQGMGSLDTKQLQKMAQIKGVAMLDPKMARADMESSIPFTECPECRGPIFHISEAKKDACYHKVRSRYKVWPSAYASGALVQCRKKGAKNWGNKS